MPNFIPSLTILSLLSSHRARTLGLGLLMWLGLLLGPTGAWANGTACYFDANGTNAGFGSPFGAFAESDSNWSLSSAGTATNTALPNDAQLTFGYPGTPGLDGSTFRVNMNGNRFIGLLINSSNVSITLVGTANAYLNGAQTWTVAAGSTLNEGITWNGAGLNFNFSSLTLNGGGTINFLTTLGYNSNAGITENDAGAGLTVNLYAANTPSTGFSGGYTLTSGKLNFASANATNALGTGRLNLNGGAMDNTSGAPMTLTGMSGITLGGNFVFNGSTNLDLGTAAVTLSGSRTVTVNANTLTMSGPLGGAYALSKAGPGTLALNAANTYSGTTIINAGRLVLGASGSLKANPSITIAGGAALDASANSAFSYAGTGFLTASSTGQPAIIKAAASGTVDLSATSLVLNYDGSNPALVIAQGAVKLSDSTQTITANTRTPLPPGTYTIMTVAGSLTHAGTYLLAGTAGSGVIVFAGNNVQMTITSSASTTATSLGLSADTTTTYGTPATFTATVSPNPGGGTVQFYVDGMVSGSAVPLANGSASLTTSAALNVGFHTIAAGYSGSGVYGPSGSSRAASLTVNPWPLPPPSPTNLLAWHDTNSILLTWSSAATATSYNIKRSSIHGGPYLTIAAGVTTTNYADTTAVLGTTYYYVVSGVNVVGEGSNSMQANALPAGFLKANRCDIRDHAATGRVVPLHGVNLGGWLFFEGWMCPGVLGTNSNPLETDLWTNFVSRFGSATTDSLMDAWRSTWVTTNDLDAVAALGMNLVRCPFNQSAFQEQLADPSVALTNVLWKPDAVAFKYLDWLVAECAKRQIYVVFDFHHPEGLDDGTLYQTPAYCDRLAYIWQRIAARYAGNPTVLGYDLVNESYGDPNLLAVENRVYKAIRAVDPDHVIISEDGYAMSTVAQEMDTYGWQNVMSSGHDYWSSWVSISNSLAVGRAAGPATTVCPFFVGEFHDGADGYPRINFYGDGGAPWASWCLKTYNMWGWSLFDAEWNGPSASTDIPDLVNDSAAVIAAKWSKWRTPPLAQLKLYQTTVNGLGGPVPVNDVFAVGTNGALALTAQMLLTNDVDLSSSNQLAVTNVPLGRTAHGTITATTNGFLYQADAGFIGVDAFTYQAVDQRLHLPAVNLGTVTLNVMVPATPVGVVAQAGSGVVNLSWIASAGAAAYNVKRATVSGGPYAVQAAGITGAGYRDTNVFACQPYFYVVSSVSAGYESPNSSEVMGKAPGSLPPQLQTADIGSVGLAGSASFCGGQFTVAGSGADVWGTADAFRFAYATLTGDGDIRARVASLSGTDAWAKAGVMIRESLTAGSRNVFQLISYSSGVSLQWRSSTGGSSSYVGQSGMAPYWVRLTRTNNTFAGYISYDGGNWTQVGTTNITMSAKVYAGLAVTAHNNSALTTSVLDSVSASFVTNVPPAVSWVAPTNQSVLIQPKAMTLVATAGDADGTVTNVAFFNGASLLGSAVSGLGNSYTLTWSNAPPGSYSLSASATDNLGATSLSAAALITVQPLTLNLVSGLATNGAFNLMFAGQNGQAYVVEVSTNLTSWAPLLTNTPVTGVVTLTDTNVACPQRFYRIRQ